MNRLLLFTLACVVAIGAVAQQSGSEGTNNNRNLPIVTTPTRTPPAAPSSTSVPSAAPTKSETVSSPGGSVAAQSGANAFDQPLQPTTEMLPEGKALSSADPVLEPKELPRKDMSLIGGTAVNVDRIRDHLQIQPFGDGKKVSVRFDDRSHIFRDGRETTVMDIKKGDRIYVDTMLVRGHIFARNLRVVTKSGSAESRGQLTSFDSKSGRVNMRDSLTGQLASFIVTQQTAMNRRGSPASPADLKPGALLDVIFAPGRDGGTADQISILAIPGEDFIFAGRVTNVDLSRGVLNVDNERDQKNYEVHFNPANLDDRNELRVGKEITARAQFDGQTYQANQLMVTSTTGAEQ